MKSKRCLIASNRCQSQLSSFINTGQPKQVPGFGAFRDYNVLLVTIDTLRADHLPAYGYTRVQTPSMDRLASESLIFEDAVAHTPMTLVFSFVDSYRSASHRTRNP